MLAVLTALLLPLCLGACEIPPTQPTASILDANPAEQPDSTDVTQQDADKPTADTPVGALIHRIDLPLDVSLDPSWLAVDESIVPLRTHGMWQANGLRIGILSAEQAPDFADTLPSILGESRAKLIGSPHPSPVRSTPRLIQSVAIDLTDPPKSPEVFRAHGGRLQLLAKITRDETGQAYLELTPHHYKRKADLVPRSPLEKQLDGQVFTPLTAHLPLTPNTAVIVGLHRPWPEPKDSADPTPDQQDTPIEDASAQTSTVKTGQDPAPDSAETTPITENETATDEQASEEVTHNDQPQPPAIPNHLGKSLMTGKRAGKTTQVLIVISIVED